MNANTRLTGVTAEGEPRQIRRARFFLGRGFLGCLSGSTCTTISACSSGLLSRSFRAAVRPASAVARAVGCGCPGLPLAGLLGFVRPSGGVRLLGCVLLGVSFVRCWWGSGVVVRLASAVPSALSGGVPVPLASRLSLPVSCRPPGGVWLRLAPCGRVVSFLRLRRTSLPRNSVGRSADAINAPQGRLQNTEFCIIDPQGVNYTPLPGYKTRILYNCTGSSADGESASPRLRHPRRGFRSNDSPSGWLPQDGRVPVPPQARRIAKAVTSPIRRAHVSGAITRVSGVKTHIIFRISTGFCTRRCVKLAVCTLILLETIQGWDLDGEGLHFFYFYAKNP